MTLRYSLLLIVALLLSPLFANGQTINASTTLNYQFQRNGIFGCNLTGSYSMSVGSLSAVGGAYVPVNDAAVTLNTGYLVYKECVLRGVVNRMRESETAALVQSITTAYQRGREGLPLFSQNLALEQRTTYDKTYVKAVEGSYLNSIRPEYQNAVKRTLIQRYLQERNNPSQVLACPQSSNYWERLGELSLNPACNQYMATVLAEAEIEGMASARWNNTLTRLGWDDGNYPVVTIDENGNEIVVTPGSIVGSNVQQALQSGFRQLENANDIDQMIGALFAGISTQVVSGVNGLMGLTQPTGSLGSYLQRVVAEAATGLRNQVGNLALQILGAAKQIEEQYLAVWKQIADLIARAAVSLREQEKACWDLVIQNVCASTPDSSNKCTAQKDGTLTLKVATSTAFSDAATATLGASASSTAINIQVSENALLLINELIAQVSNTSDPATQQRALYRLDELALNRRLHIKPDLDQAIATKDNISASMDRLVREVSDAWQKSMDVSVGWCNVSSNTTAVRDYWTDKWKQ